MTGPSSAARASRGAAGVRRAASSVARNTRRERMRAILLDPPSRVKATQKMGDVDRMWLVSRPDVGGGHAAQKSFGGTRSKRSKAHLTPAVAPIVAGSQFQDPNSRQATRSRGRAGRAGAEDGYLAWQTPLGVMGVPPGESTGCAFP